MDKEQRQIKEFMEKAGQSYPTTPTIPDEKTIKLRLDLIIEEVAELAEACGYELTTQLSVAERIEDQRVDMVEVADAFTDINYVTKGGGVSFGIDLQPIFELVHKSNMAKFGPGGYRRDDGKWIKPPDWVKPNIAAELNSQSPRIDVNAQIDKMVEDADDKRPLGRISQSIRDFEQAMIDSNARVLGGIGSRPMTEEEIAAIPKDRVFIANPKAEVAVLIDKPEEMEVLQGEHHAL